MEPTKICSKCTKEFPATTEYFNGRKGSKDGLRGYCRKCHVHYAMEWGKANPDQYAENQRHSTSAYRARNRELVLERTREWKSKNKPHLRRYIDEWRSENDPRLRSERANQRSDERGLPSDFGAEDWLFAIAYFNGCCAVCQRKLHGLFHTASIDHWIPLSDPTCPGTVTTNIVPLCCGKDGCNDSKNRKPPEQWLISKYGEKQAREVLARIHEFFSSVRN